MKNFAISMFVICAAVFFCGCDKEQKSDVDEATLAKIDVHPSEVNVPAPAGGLVLSVASTAITANEIITLAKPQLAEFAAQSDSDYETFRTKAKPILGRLLMRKIADIKLYQKAKAALPENVDEETINKIVEQEVGKFVAGHGGNYATVEKKLREDGKSWQSFREDTKRWILVQSFLSNEVKVEKPITHSELLQYYDSIKDESFAKDALIEFRLIDLETNKFVDVNDPNVNAEQKALAKADEIERKIKSDANFAELARQFSNDSTAADGGLWKPVRPGSLVEPYTAIETAAVNMSVGQISEPIIAGGHIFIVKLENKQAASCEPFEKVQQEVEERFILSRRQKTVEDMLAKIVSHVDLSYADDFLNYCVQQAYKEVKN